MSTGVPGLDALLGGGLLPGTLTVVAGATGIGKTQLGLSFADAGLAGEGRRGCLFDLTARGDDQNHGPYARRIAGWELREGERTTPSAEELFDPNWNPGDYLRVFDQLGRRVTRGDVSDDAWNDWQAELARKLAVSTAFFYGHFLRGGRRAVFDGIEPVDRPSESVQFELFEYLYQHAVRREHDWTARELLRERFRANAERVAERAYDHRRIACLMLYTTKESLLDALVERPLDQGDVLSNATTIILLGKIREGREFLRAAYVAKHRGSRAVERITPYEITEAGWRMLE
jgi:hypothetical protein